MSRAEDLPVRRRVSVGALAGTVMATGCGIIMLEIVGARLAGPIFGVSLYIWTALITVTLTALAAGYFFGGVAADRFPSADAMFALILGSALLIALIPSLGRPTLAMCYRALGIRLGVLAGSFVLFGPPLTLLGMISPYAIRLGLADLERTGRTVGGLYAISTVGSVIGAILTGYALIPVLGVTGTLLAATVTISAPPAIWFVVGRRWGLLGAGATLLALGAATAWARPGLRPLGPDVVLVESREGFYGQVKVVDFYDVGEGTRWLLLDGTAQTGMYLDSRELVSDYVQTLVDFLSLHPPQGKRALLVGMGGGALLRPLAESGYEIDLVEIDPLVVEMAEAHFDCRPDWYSLICEDGRAYIRRTQKRYDAVVFDVFSGGGQPYHLFAREAFEETRRILAPGGLVALNSIAFAEGEHARLAASLLRTASSVFPQRKVFLGHPDEPLDEIDNILMFFSETALELPDPEAMTEAQAGAWDRLSPRALELDVELGRIITDDWNPVDRWSAEVNRAWRDRVFQNLGGETLAY